MEHIRYKTPENYTSKKLHAVGLYRDGTQSRGRGVNAWPPGRSFTWTPGNRQPATAAAAAGTRSRPPATARAAGNRQPFQATGNRNRLFSV